MKPPAPVTPPGLDALAANPACIQLLPPDLQTHLYRQAARLEAELRTYLLTHPAGERNTPKGPDDILTIREAAGLLRVSLDSLYRRWKRLPGAYKDGLDGRLKFRRASLERYVDHLQTTAVKG